MSFWLYIQDYYENFAHWKHILHKGTEPDNFEITYEKWDVLTSELREQSPGLWIHPSQNSLRLSFTTEIDKDFCKLSNNQNDCLDKNYCHWNGMKCDVKNPHAYTNITFDGAPKKNINNTNITNIEYIDIDNIPVKTMTHISFVLEQKILNVYLNGKLLKIHKFLGTPIFNKMPLVFNYQKSFGGSLFDFRYLPYEVSS